MQRSNASKDKLFAIIAQDLRAPFTGLIGLTDFIVKNVDRLRREELQEPLFSLREMTESVYLLLENLLTWAGLQQGKLELTPQPTKIYDLADRNLRFFCAENRAEKNIRRQSDSQRCDRVG